MGGVDTAEIRKLLVLREKKEKAEAAFDDAKDKHDEQQQIVWDALDDAKQKSITVDVGPPWGEVNIGKRETIRGRVIDRDTLIESLKSEGYDVEAVFKDIRKKWLNEEVNKRLRAGKDLPDGADFSSTKYVQIAGR